MIDFLCNKCCAWLLRSQAIEPKDEELYQYALFCFFITALPIVIVVLWGIAFGMVKESILLILPFAIIRKFSGGFHLKSSNKCMVISTILLALFLQLISLVCHHSLYIAVDILLVVSAISLCVFSPIDSEERQLSEREKLDFHRITIVIVLVISAILCVLRGLGWTDAYVSIACGLLLSAGTQWPCVILMLLNKKNAVKPKSVAINQTLSSDR